MFGKWNVLAFCNVTMKHVHLFKSESINYAAHRLVGLLYEMDFTGYSKHNINRPRPLPPNQHRAPTHAAPMHWYHARPSWPVNQNPNPGPAEPGVFQLHNTAAWSSCSFRSGPKKLFNAKQLCQPQVSFLPTILAIPQFLIKGFPPTLVKQMMRLDEDVHETQRHIETEVQAWKRTHKSERQM